MVLKLYGYDYSTAARRVALVCKELNVPYEYVVIDLSKGAHKSPEFLKLQPFGQVPLIDDDGFILYESRAICRYLAAKHKSSLLPTGLKENAKFELAASLEFSHFDPLAAKLGYEKVVKPIQGKVPDEEVAKGLYDGLKAKMAIYDTILAKQKYLAGDELTLADLSHLPWGHVIEGGGYKFYESYPNVKRWWNDISSRPSWQAVKNGL